MTELIIACNALAAATYATKSGWNTYEGNQWRFDRKEGGEWVPVRYVPHADHLRDYAHEAPIWIGPFPHGMPSDWAKALETRKIANGAELLATGIGELRPMSDRSAEGNFLAFRIGHGWEIARWSNESPGYIDGSYAADWDRFACWRELPAPPPQFLVRTALELNRDRVQDRDDRAGPHSSD